MGGSQRAQGTRQAQGAVPTIWVGIVIWAGLPTRGAQDRDEPCPYGLGGPLDQNFGFVGKVIRWVKTTLWDMEACTAGMA